MYAACAHLSDLLLLLDDRMALGSRDPWIQAAVTSTEPDTPWQERLASASEVLGLDLRWISASPRDAAAMARPDLPLVSRGADGTYWVVDGRFAGWVRVTAVPSRKRSRWMSVGAFQRALEVTQQPFALLQPRLPAAPLASDAGLSPMRRLAALLWMDRRDVAIVIVYGLVAGLLALATPLAIQVLINWLAFGALLQPILILGIALFVCLLLAASLQSLQRVGVEVLERRLFVRTVGDLSVRLSRVRAEALDDVSGPELANRFFDVLTLQKATGTLLLDGFTALLQVGVAVALLAVYHPWLLLFDLFLLAGMAAVIGVLGRGGTATSLQESKSKYAVAAWIEEVARHPLVLRQDHGELAERRAEELTRAWLATRQDHFRVFLRQYLGAQSLQVLMSAVLLVASGALVLQGELTLGQLVAAEFIVTTALLGFAKFADKLDTVYDLLAGIDKLGSLLDLPVERPTGLMAEGTGPLEVRLVDAEVRYPDHVGMRPTGLVLARGSSTTVLGAPGTGKSTLAELVTGLRAPTAGAVLHDGVDVQQRRPSARYDGVVRVNAADILTSSLRDNITLGRPGISEHDIWRALERVGLRSRAEGLPEGLDTWILPDGGALTMVERRAVLLARALVRMPRLVVVDGVLDGLTGEDRRRLTRCLRRPDAPVTLLILTDDPSVASSTSDTPLILDEEGLHV
ncbi:MAG: ABC transporter ATP-binding protein/permease [Myxococcales bacterium]|nr:ABC transporter ATP-binding protein/permease [Myxococcales bacterium]